MKKTLLYSSLLAASLLTLAACGDNDHQDKKTDATGETLVEADAIYDESGQELAIKKAPKKQPPKKQPPRKQPPKKKPQPKGPLWRCVAVGVNFFDGLRYAGDGPTRTAANNKAIAACQSSGPNRKCAVITSPLPGLFTAGGCGRLR